MAKTTNISSGIVSSGLIVSSGTRLNVNSGGTAVAIKEEGGIVSWDSGAVVSFVPSVFSNYVFSGIDVGGHATIHSGTTAVSATITNSGWVKVYNGGLVTNAHLKNSGDLLVYSGGEARDTIADQKTNMNVYSGGTASGIVVSSGGSLNVASDGTAVAIKEEGGLVTWDSGAVVSFVPSVFSNYVFSGIDVGGHATIHSGTTAVSATITNSAWVKVYNGGLVTDTNLKTGAGLHIYSGGMATDTVANYNTDMNVYSGGTVSGIVVSSGGSLNVASDGTAVAIKEEGGLVTWDSGAVVSFIPSVFSNYVFSGIGLGGHATIHSGTTATSTTITNSAWVKVYNGGLVTDTNLKTGAGLHIYSGAAALYTIVNSGTSLFVYTGGAILDVVVSKSARLTASSGACLTGQMIFEDGAVVSALSGSLVDFDLTRVNAGNAAIVSDLSLIKGAPTYSLTVSGSQKSGNYILAEGASGFNKTIVVLDDQEYNSIGLISVGETATINGVDYTLKLSDGTLSVEVVSSVVPAPDWTFYSGDFNGDGKATLAVQTGKEVTIYQNGEAWGNGLLLDDGWTLAGVGDFNGDNLDDFLRIHTSGLVIGEMSDGNGGFSPQVLNFKNTGWDILSTGNFDGVGADDVLIANPTAASDTVGLLGYWKGGTEWTLINGYSPEWTMVSTGDFNGDGKCDMLWKNSFVGEGGLTYNAYCTWIVEDPVDWRMVSVANPDEWNFLCSGDFDGNGSHDIAMINNVGVVGIWGVNDGYLSSWSILSAVTNEWTLAGVADFNGDGTDDIAWSNTATGLTGYWQINDKQLTTWENIAVIS